MIVFDDDPARLDLARVHGWLASRRRSPVWPDRYMGRLAPAAAVMPRPAS